MKSREWANIGAVFGHFAALLDAPAVQTGWGEPHWEGHQLPSPSPPPALPGITASPAPLLPYVASRWRMVSSEPSWPGLVDGRQAGKVRGLWRRELCFFRRKQDLSSSASGILTWEITSMYGQQREHGSRIPLALGHRNSQYSALVGRYIATCLALIVC